MIQGMRMCAGMIMLALTATGAATLGGGGDDRAANPAAPKTPAAKPGTPAARPDPSMAKRLEEILAEYQARLDDLTRALEKARDSASGMRPIRTCRPTRSRSAAG